MPHSKWTHGVRLVWLSQKPKTLKCRVLVTKFAVRSTPKWLTEIHYRPILGMYRDNYMACAETQVNCSKRSGCHGGRCSSSSVGFDAL
jgi:hypothetical protein